MIPYLEENINSRSVEHMAETMEQFRGISEYMESEAEKWKISCVKEKNGIKILDKEAFTEVPEILKSIVLHQLLGEIAGKKKDIEMVHVRTLLELLEKQVGRRCDLPYEICAVRCYEGLEFIRRDGRKEEMEPQVRMKVFPREERLVTFPEKVYTKWFDYDIIKCTVKLRHREPGDYITVNKNGGTKKLKRYFIDEKIPQKERDQIWLLADGSHIMWIVGYRQNQAYQITEKTRNILEVEIDGGEKQWQKQSKF